MRFCPQCGAPVMTGAKFCVECGRALTSGAGGAGRSMARTVGDLNFRNLPITTAFIGVFLAITVLGLAAAAWIMLRPPEVARQQVVTAAPPAASMAQPEQRQPAASPAAESSAGQGSALPPGHPKIELPTEARTFIDRTEQAARANPGDVKAWTRFGSVAMRAALFDQSYYGKAQDAYAHALKLEPDNLDALRGIGDIDYDQQHYDEAIAAYEHYLKKKPDDPEVRTDLGTMYLYTGNADQAVVQYRKALKSKPDFYQAFFNMGVAYAQENQPAKAQASLAQALKFAPDDNARAQVREVIAKVGGAPASELAAASPTAQASLAAQASSAASAAPAPSKQKAVAKPPQEVAAASPAASPSAAAPTASASVASAAEPSPAAASEPSAPPTPVPDFHDAIEQMVRNMPVAGPKVGAVLWPEKFKAKVMMENFPMDQMPPFARQKFLADLKIGILDAKKEHRVSGKVELQIVDGISGKVMQTVTE